MWKWAADAGVPIAEQTVVWRELCLLAERLYTDIYKHYQGAETGNVYKWHDKNKKVRVSGTVIQQEIFTNPVIHGCCPNFLHLYQMCALKSMNEAVVEGMCKVVDTHAIGGRGLDLKRYAYESIIHYNMPAINECREFIRACIERYSNKFKKCSMLRFHSTDKRQRALRSFVSKTVDRHRGKQSRLTFM